MRLKIDGIDIPLEWGATLPKDFFNYTFQSLRDVESTRQGAQLSLRVPASTQAAQMFQGEKDCFAGTRFNGSYHQGVVEIGDVEIISGVVHLTAIEQDESRVCAYHINIRQSAGDWADKAAVTDIAASKIEYQATLNGELISQSWTDDSAVKFFPIHNDSYPPSSDVTTLAPRMRHMSIADYHPFISLQQLLKAIFAASGYSIESRWLESSLASKLYLSGAYSQRKTSSVARLQSIAGFNAGRSASGQATASALGIVYVNPLVVQHSVGNFVDTCQTDVAPDLYDNNGTLRFGNDGITFTPPTAMSVGFDFHLKYLSPYRIVSRNRLRCFDRICVEPGCDVTFPVPNTFKDSRSSVVGGVSHRVVLFDYDPQTKYRFRWVTALQTYDWVEMNSHTTTSTAPSVTNKIQGQVEQLVGQEWVPYSGDWALYESYIQEQGTIELEAVVSMAPQSLSPTNPKCFNAMFIGGGEAGWSLTLLPECRLKPRFTASPALGSTLSFESVAQHGFKQIDLLRAVAHMFNLCFFTDERRKRVYIEPYDDMFAGQVVDWRARVDCSRGFKRCDAAQNIAQIRRLAYRSEGGGSVNRYNNREDTSLGVWATKSDSYIARQGVEKKENALFCPTLTTTGILPSAPSAGVLSVGDRDSDTLEEHNVRIVLYEGLVPLPKGESWGFPSGGTEYPFAAFHYPYALTQDNGAIEGEQAVAGAREGFTLCFEDRDGEQGLNHYYRRLYDEESLSERVTLAVRLTPREMVALREKSATQNLCTLYRLPMGEESFIARIEAIEGYDVESQTATICFARQRVDDAKV